MPLKSCFYVFLSLLTYNDMIKIEHKVFPFYQFENMGELPGIRHFVSSGVKSIGFSDRVDPVRIRHFREELAQAVGFDPARVVMGHQVHSDRVAVVTEADAGKGALARDNCLAETDALVTNRVGICLTVLSADCVPVLLCDPFRQVVAAVHAGWRGTAAGIVGRTVGVMHDKFGCCPEQVYAGIGPSIGKCCFEVGEDVARIFYQLLPACAGIVSKGKNPGKFQIDLWEVNRQQLLACGLIPSHIEVAGMCTVCHPDAFFSYRKDREGAGRFGAGILLG